MVIAARLLALLLATTGIAGSPAGLSPADGNPQLRGQSASAAKSPFNLRDGERSGLRRELNLATGAIGRSDAGVQAASQSATLPDEIYWDRFELCGNGVIDAGEQCDRTDLASATCQSLGYPGGSLGCTQQCQFDVSACAATCSALACTTDNDCGGPACGPCFQNICLGALGTPAPGKDP